MKNIIQIETAIIIRRDGHTDIVYLGVKDLPSAVWPFNGTLTLRFDCAAGSAEEYIMKNLSGVPYEVKKF